MHNGIHFARNEDEIGDIVPNKRKIRMTGQMRQIIGMAGNEVIHPDNHVTLGEQAIA
jgi:hypothetical protein